ncbi:hypothetical protein NMY22_g10613 [Coprinellus aureogranulatus]|nr:hypothetical protein NMY22_g10613 [Coprinellus aureogranulatus]
MGWMWVGQPMHGFGSAGWMWVREPMHGFGSAGWMRVRERMHGLPSLRRIYLKLGGRATRWERGSSYNPGGGAMLMPRPEDYLSPPNAHGGHQRPSLRKMGSGSSGSTYDIRVVPPSRPHSSNQNPDSQYSYPPASGRYASSYLSPNSAQQPLPQPPRVPGPYDRPPSAPPTQPNSPYSAHNGLPVGFIPQSITPAPSTGVGMPAPIVNGENLDERRRHRRDSSAMGGSSMRPDAGSNMPRPESSMRPDAGFGMPTPTTSAYGSQVLRWPAVPATGSCTISINPDLEARKCIPASAGSSNVYDTPCIYTVEHYSTEFFLFDLSDPCKMPPKKQRDPELIEPAAYVSAPVRKGAAETKMLRIWRDRSSNEELLRCDNWVGHQESIKCGVQASKLLRTRTAAQAKKAHDTCFSQPLNSQSTASSQDSQVPLSISIPEVRINDIGLPPSSPPEPSSPTSPPILERSPSPTPQHSFAAPQSDVQYTPFVVVHPDSDSDCESVLSDLAETEVAASYNEEMANPCRGLPVRWSAGPVWSSYSFWQHESPDYSWKPIGFVGDHIIVIRSRFCTKRLSTLQEKSDSRCWRCHSLESSDTLQSNKERARGVKSTTPYRYLSMVQLSRLLKRKREENTRLRSQNRFLRRQVMRLKVKVDEGRRIVMKLASQDIPGASRVLEVSLKRSESANEIMRKLEGAITGAFLPHGNWTEREFDIAYLVKALGGPRLTFAMQNARHSPSLTTLRRHRSTPKMVMCVDTPTDEEIWTNVDVLLGGRQPLDDLGIGQSMMSDGIAIEEVPRWDEATNKVLGGCREHSSNIAKEINTLGDLERLAKGLHDKEWHRAKEAILVSLAPMTHRDNYWPSPLFAFPSCGSGKGSDMADIMRRTIDIYNRHPKGRALHGDIVCAATDGESSFRGARYELALTKLVSPPLYEKLRGLTGLNLAVGPGDLLGCCDPKHIFKRFAQNLRSTGLQLTLGDVVIGYHDIRSALRHSGVTEERMNMLLNPQDKQNVPIALDLLKELKNANIPDTTEANRIRHVKLLAEIYSFFITPFTDITLGLAAQVRKLSTYAHLIFALYRRHGRSFMNGALYGDSISIVKTIIILIARYQTKDGEIRFYIILVGTDRVEGIFSHVRTQDHARNCDIVQFGDKCCIGAEINRIVLNRPELDPGHEKRAIKDSKGEDHINTVSWDKNAELRVGSVVLDGVFFDGRRDAEKWLRDNLGWVIDWEKEYGTKNDLSKPDGDFIGSKAASGSGNDDDVPAAAQASSVPNNTGDASAERLPTAAELEETPEEILGIESHSSHAIQSDSGTPATRHSKYIVVDGKRYHKSSLVPKYLTAPSSRKVVIRQFRAAGMTISDLVKGSRIGTSPSEAGNSAGKEYLVNGDIGAFLFKGEKDDIVALAVLEILHFRQGSAGSSKNLFKMERSELDKSNVWVVGQVMELAFDANYLGGQWEWTRNYVNLAGDDETEGVRHRLSITIPGMRFALLQPNVRSGSVPGESTWVFPRQDLDDAKGDLWALLDPGSDEMLLNLDSLPRIKASNVPYRTEQGYAFVVDDAASFTVQKHGADDIVPCHLCGISCKLKVMRNHIGAHLLKYIRRVPDVSLRADVDMGDEMSVWCGWCGRHSEGCKTQFKAIGKDKYSILSNCTYHYEGMKYSSAAKYSKSSPCTNVPIPCTLCSSTSDSGTVSTVVPTVWKYNLQGHLNAHHIHGHGDYPLLPPRMILSAYTSKEEERALGIIEQKTIEARDLLGIPAQSEGNMPVIEEDDRKRPRSDSTSNGTQSQKRKKKKKSYPPEHSHRGEHRNVDCVPGPPLTTTSTRPASAGPQTSVLQSVKPDVPGVPFLDALTLSPVSRLSQVNKPNFANVLASFKLLKRLELDDVTFHDLREVVEHRHLVPVD